VGIKERREGGREGSEGKGEGKGEAPRLQKFSKVGAYSFITGVG